MKRRQFLSVGDPVPHFTLNTPHGVDVSLRECLLRGAAVIEFVRGTWDPNSRARLHELSEWQRGRRDGGARLLVVTCERAMGARRFLDENPCPLSLLVDEGRLVARAFGVFRRFSFGAWQVARPATFVTDACGFVRLAHIARTPIDHCPTESITTTLDDLALESRRHSPPG